MSDKVTYNFTSATSMLKAINECDDYLNSLISKLLYELEKAEKWWEGESFQSYKKLYIGPGGRKLILVRAADKAAFLGSRLQNIAGKKREWEQTGSRKF